MTTIEPGVQADKVFHYAQSLMDTDALLDRSIFNLHCFAAWLIESRHRLNAASLMARDGAGLSTEEQIVNGHSEYQERVA